MGLLGCGHSDAMSQEDLFAPSNQAWFSFPCVGGDGKLSRAFFVAVAVEDAISGEVCDLAVG